ncbi:MAG: serine/threonine-protein kinase [Sandaracinaceae bacterium]
MSEQDDHPGGGTLPGGAQVPGARLPAGTLPGGARVAPQQAPPPAAPMPSVIAGRYRLDRVLGEGGMGAVYEATQLQLNRQVAIKVMLPHVSADEEARRRFEREARVSAALRHDHVVEVFDFGEDQGRLFLVMEKLVGIPMDDLVGKKHPPLPLPRTLSILEQVSSALVAAHAIQLVHRDLKPANVFLEKHRDGGDRAVVVDFGLAFIAEREDAERLTQAGMITGTPSYMSPEQIRGQDIAPPSDIYSLGCVAYEMITSRTPFQGHTGLLMSKHMFERPVPPSQMSVNMYVPTALDELVLRMMSKQREARPTAVQVHAAIAAIRGGLNERERSRGAEFLGGRDGRMVDTASPAPVAAPAGDGPVVAIAGQVGDEIRLGLSSNGITALVIDQPVLPPDTAVVYVPNAEPNALAACLPLGCPVITDADVRNAAWVQQLMAMGVKDVLPQPVQVEQLAQKIRRAARRSRRRRNR